jgi:Leucine-rich repeat (LRR) protein
MGSYFSQLVHEAVLADGDSSLKLHGVKLSKKDAQVYGIKLVEQLGSKLHYLSIDRAKLKSVPVEICTGLSVLKHMQLAGNQLADLPAAFSSLKSVTSVILASNEFVRMPTSLMQCKNLKKLDMSNNALKAIPESFGESLMSLETLVLSGNRLEDASSWPGLLNLSKLRVLDLRNNQLKQISLGISSLSVLQELNLSHNEISALEPLAKMTCLTILELSHLQFDPSAFASPSSSSSAASNSSSKNAESTYAIGNGIKTILKLSQLQVLDLSHNRLASIASELFTTLTKLTTLRLHNNKLLRIPKEIGALTSLSTLLLQENQLLKVGKQLSQCANLEVLRLEFNNLSKLPAAMRSMAKLHCLMLHHNKFRIIPEPLYDAGFVSHLYTLSLEGNPLTPEILRHIAEKGTREYVLERECKLREEEEAAGKRKGRPSLTRIASQYGSLRGGSTSTAPTTATGMMPKRPALTAIGTLSSATANPGFGTLRRQSMSQRFPIGPDGAALAGMANSASLPVVPQSTSPAASPAIASNQATTSENSGASSTPAIAAEGAEATANAADGSASSSASSASSSASGTPTTPTKNGSAVPSNLRTMSRSSSNNQLPSATGRTFTRSKTSSSPTAPVATAIGSDGSTITSSSSASRVNSINSNKAKERALSSPSRVSGAPTSLSQIVKPDHTLEIPPYSRFKEAFEHLMEQQDLSEARREELRKAPVEAKWEMMRVYKGNLVQLLSNNTARMEREKKFESWQKLDKKIERLASPQYFISSLKGQNISMGDMTTLKSMFESAPLPWIYEFIDYGGITELARFMMFLMNHDPNKDKAAQDIVKETEAISCMSVLASASSSLVLSATDAIFGVVLCLASDQLATIKPALKLLVHIHSEHSYTSKVILRALERAMPILNLPARFTLFINLLSDLPHLKQDYEVKADVLALIGKMCDSMPLIERYLLRKELIKIGFDRVLMELNDAPHHALQQQLEMIDETSFADSEAVKTLAATDYRVLLRIQDDGENSTNNANNTTHESGDTTSRNGNYNHLSSTSTSAEAGGSMKLSNSSSSLSAAAAATADSKSPSITAASIASGTGSPAAPGSAIVGGNIKILVGDMGTNNVRYTTTTTVGEVMKKVLARYTIDHPELYRLFFLSTNTAKMEGVWADDPSALVAEFAGKFGGECLASFKMKPFKLTVDCSFAKTSVVTDLEPTWSIQQSIAHIVTSNNFSLDGDYQLSVLLEPSELNLVENSKSGESEMNDAEGTAAATATIQNIRRSNANTPSLPTITDDAEEIEHPTTTHITSDAVDTTTGGSSSVTTIVIPLPISAIPHSVAATTSDLTASGGSMTKSDSSTSVESSSEVGVSSSTVLTNSGSGGGGGGIKKSAGSISASASSSSGLSLHIPVSSILGAAPADCKNTATSPRSPHSPKNAGTPRFSVIATVETNVPTAPFTTDDVIAGASRPSSPILGSSQSDAIEGAGGAGVGAEASVSPRSAAASAAAVTTLNETSSTGTPREGWTSASPSVLAEEEARRPDSKLAEVSPASPLAEVDLPHIPIPSLYRAPVNEAAIPEAALPEGPKRVILSDEDTLHSLKYSDFSVADLLSGKVMLQLALRPTKLKIFMGDEGVFMEVDVRWTISELLRQIALKVPEVQDTIGDYGIMLETKQRRETKRRSVQSSKRSSSRRTMMISEQSNATLGKGSQVASEWLAPNKTLAYYDFDQRKHTLRLALRPRELFVILPNGRETSISIGFEESVSAVIKLVISHLDSESGANYSLFSGPTLLSRIKSLRSAGVRPGDHLVLRQEAEAVGPATDQQDVDIWEEPHTDEYIVYETPESGSASTSSSGSSNPSSLGAATARNSRLVGAISLNKIIERLTNPSDMDPDFLEIFVFTYRSFTTPEQVLAKLMQRYEVPEKNAEGVEISDREADMIRVRVCVFLTQWLDRSFADIDDLLMEKLNIWIENGVSEDRRPLLFNALGKVRTRKLATTEQLAPNVIEVPEVGAKVTLMDLDVAEMARQLTVYTWSIYTQIKPLEFFDCAWSKPKLQHLAPNVLEMIARFNFIAGWCASEICSEPKLRVRRTKFTKIVKLAVLLREMGNYHMLYALVTGWNNSAVSRLKWTIEKLPKATKTNITELETLMSMEGSFKNYREALKRVGNASCIPYIGILTKDLTFIEDGNPNEINGLINWYKRRLVHVIVGEYLRPALVPFRMPPVVVNGIHIREIMKNLSILDDNAVYDASLKAEPRGAKPEQLQ